MSLRVAMKKALSPMLKIMGLPDNLTELVDSVRITKADFDIEEADLVLYCSVFVKDKESLDNLRQLSEVLTKILKEQNQDG